jgi:hypothetical protein
MSSPVIDDFAPRGNSDLTDMSERMLLGELVSTLRDILEEMRTQNAYAHVAAEINELNLKMLKAQMGGGIVQGLVLPGKNGH